MRIFLAALIFLLSIFWCIYALSKYKSAFEADQQCHYEISILQEDFDNLNCDHDTETRQWILFDASTNNQPAKVLKRFRY